MPLLCLGAMSSVSILMLSSVFSISIYQCRNNDVAPRISPFHVVDQADALGPSFSRFSASPVVIVPFVLTSLRRPEWILLCNDSDAVHIYASILTKLKMQNKSD